MPNPSLKKYHFYQGAVLSRLLHNEKPIQLMLVEKNSDEWGAYRVGVENEQYILYCKYSSKPISNSKRNVKKWQFTFTEIDKERLRNYLQKPEQLRLILVCVAGNIDRHINEVCIMGQDELKKCLDLNQGGSVQTILITYEAGRSLWVKSTKCSEPFRSKRNSISLL